MRSRAAPPACFLHHRAVRLAHRHDQGRSSRFAAGTAEGRSDDCRAAQATRLCNRAIRQEPSWRSQRIFADRTRLRRVLRQPLSPECRGRARTAGLSEGPGIPVPSLDRGASWTARRRTRTIRRSIRASDGSGKQVCTDTGPLTKARMVGIDDDIANRAAEFIKRTNKAGKPAFVWVNFSICTSAPTPSPKASVSPVAGRARITTHDRPRQKCRDCAQGIDDEGIAGQHLRHVLDR